MFYSVYLSVTIILIAGIVAALLFMRGWLIRFEASQPKYALAPYEALFASRDYAALLELSSEGDSGELALYHLPGDIAVYETYTSQANTTCYQVRAGGERVGEILLARDSADDSAWKLSQMTLTRAAATPPPETPRALYTFHIIAPAGATVTVEGVALTDNDIAETNIPGPAKGHLPKKTPAPKLTKYMVKTDSAAPEITALSPEGGVYRLEYDGDQTYSTLPLNDRKLQKAREKRAIEVAKNFALFTADDITRAKMLSFAVKNSPGYKTIKGFDNRWFLGHSSHRFSKVRAAYFVKYSSTCFSCDVSFVFSVKTRDKKTVDTPTRMTCYFQKDKKVWRLYDFVLGTQLLTARDCEA